MPKERGDDGQYRPTVNREDLLGVFGAVRGPVVSSADVADELGVSSETARRKLNQLVDDGVLEKRKTAGRVIYWEASRDDLAPPSDQAQNRILQGRPELESTSSETTGGEGDPQPAGPDSGVEVDLEDLTFKRELTPERREVLTMWLQYVREEGDGVTKSDFKAWWGDDRAAGTGYKKPGAFWEAFAKAAMKESKKFDKPNARTYRWVGAE